MKKKLLAAITAAAMAMSLVACGGVTISGVALPESVNLEKGATQQLQLEYSAEGDVAAEKIAEAAGKLTVEWSSSDESIVTVDAEGNVTAVADGTATITVDVNGVTAECEVTVSTKAASTAGNSNNGSSAASSGQTQDSAVASSSFEYGAIPFSLASNGNWWGIDQSDSAYWAVLNNINAMRAAGGLSALSPSSSLDAIADSRCDYQLVNDTLSHDGAQTPEILAQSQKSASEVCTGWQNSPSHYAVIMNPNFTQIGICCYFEIGGKTIWCCTFS